MKIKEDDVRGWGKIKPKCFIYFFFTSLNPILPAWVKNRPLSAEQPLILSCLIFSAFLSNLYITTITHSLTA